MLLVSAGGNGAGMGMHGVPQGWSLISVSISISAVICKAKNRLNILIYMLLMSTGVVTYRSTYQSNKPLIFIGLPAN